jgi:nitrogen regulatory protein P-II 1
MYMVMCVIDDPSLLEDVLVAWQQIGVTGATILESTGMQRRLGCQLLIPQRYAFEGLTESCSEGHNTLFSIVPDEATAQASLLAAEKVTGDFTLPHTGVFASWPLAFVKGTMDEQNSDQIKP